MKEHKLLKIMSARHDDLGLTLPQKIVYATLVSMLPVRGGIITGDVSGNELARISGSARKTVVDSINKLEELGLLSRVNNFHSNGGIATNTYTIL